MEETTAVATGRRNFSEEERDRLREWISKARKDTPEATGKDLHARALLQLGYPASAASFYHYLHQVIEADAAEGDAHQSPQAAAHEPIDRALDRADDDTAALAPAASEPRARVHRREFTTPAGYATLEGTAGGPWELRAVLTFADRAEALAHYRRLEEEVADAAA